MTVKCRIFFSAFIYSRVDAGKNKCFFGKSEMKIEELCDVIIGGNFLRISLWNLLYMKSKRNFVKCLNGKKFQKSFWPGSNPYLNFRKLLKTHLYSFCLFFKIFQERAYFNSHFTYLVHTAHCDKTSSQLSSKHINLRAIFALIHI